MAINKDNKQIVWKFVIQINDKHIRLDKEFHQELKYCDMLKHKNLFPLIFQTSDNLPFSFSP